MKTLFIPACLLALAVGSLGTVSGPQATVASENAKFITNSLGMKLTLIRPGKFLMGSPATEEDRDAEEMQHEVTISRPFFLGVYEVTQEQYQAVMGKNPSFFQQAQGGGPGHPVEQVRWPDAVEFCKRLSERAEEKQAGRVYRLPTEAEWEYACRAGTTTPFHFGAALSSQQANYNGNYPFGKGAKGPNLQKTTKVGSYAPNPWGLYDMHGNVWEWCADWYDPDCYKASPKQDPKGPLKGVISTGFRGDFFRVVRGGCWIDEARSCRSACRFRLQPHDPYRWAGFRVVCEAAGTPKGG